MLLVEVIGDVVHVPHGPRTPEIGIELLGWFNEVTSSICFVCTFDLIQG